MSATLDSANIPRRRLLLAGLALPVYRSFAQAVDADRPITVAAASDLKFAFDEIVAAFTKQAGDRIRVTYGSTGDLTRQIEQGAPFELFLAADESFIQHLFRAGRTVDSGRNYALGRLDVFLRRGVAPPSLPLAVDRFRSWIHSDTVKRVAMANPSHAPYGRAARAALQHVGAWDGVQSKIVMGENVSQAAQFAVTGAVEVAFIATSLVKHPSIAQAGTALRVPDAWYPPLIQRMARIKPREGGVRDGVTRLYDAMSSSESQAILARYGFAPPPIESR